MPRSAKRRKSFKDNLIVYDSMSEKPGTKTLIKSYNLYKNLRVQQNYLIHDFFQWLLISGPSCSHSPQEPLRLPSPDSMVEEDINSNTTHFDCLRGTSKNSSKNEDFSKGHDCDSLLALPKGDFDTHENQMVNRLLETHENNLAGIFLIWILTSLGMSKVDTVWAWGGQTSTSPIS